MKSARLVLAAILLFLVVVVERRHQQQPASLTVLAFGVFEVSHLHHHRNRQWQLGLAQDHGCVRRNRREVCLHRAGQRRGIRSAQLHEDQPRLSGSAGRQVLSFSQRIPYSSPRPGRARRFCAKILCTSRFCGQNTCNLTRFVV